MKHGMFLLSLVALAVATSVAPPATAGAASNVGPLAGIYSGEVVQGGGITYGSRAFWVVGVTITDAGRIGGVANYFPPASGGLPTSPPGDGAARGSISEDGAARLTLSDRTTLKLDTTLEADADGNLYGSTPDWFIVLYRQ